MSERANAAILYAAEAYSLSGPKIMGRQAAGHAFLRAAVEGREGQPLWAYTAQRATAEQFGQQVKTIDPAAEARWCPADRLDLLEQIGALHVPGPTMNPAARLRLRQGVAAYSLCGVTHTTASHEVMDSISSLLTGPFMPWDALICTSSAVAETVRVQLRAQADYLTWRFGGRPKLTLPQLPVIPLGVHCDDYAFAQGERARARAELGIAADEVVALFVGRLSFHAKAHPDAMYLGLQGAASKTGRKVVLLQCGWFANDAIEAAFRSGGAACPDVRLLFADGRNAGRLRECWAAADLFVSLSDNIQETFGLTPIEAMAAGLPVVVTDWDGYKDTVRDGEDGFRIPTWMPPAGAGAGLAKSFEAGTSSYDAYCGLSSQMVSVDPEALAETLSLLVADEALRRAMGEAGKARARALYHWPVLYREYRRLWDKLRALRAQAQEREEWRNLILQAPRAAPSRLDPCQSFAHYPTSHIGPETLVSRSPRPDLRDYAALASHPFFSYGANAFLGAEPAAAILDALGTSSSVAALSDGLGMPASRLVPALGLLAKMGLLRLGRRPLQEDGAA